MSEIDIFPEFERSEDLLRYSSIRRVYFDEAVELEHFIRTNFRNFLSVEDFYEEFHSILFVTLEQVLELCVRRLGLNYEVFEYSKEDIYQELIINSSWLEQSYSDLFSNYLSARSRVEKAKQLRDVQLKNRPQWVGGGFGFKGAVSSSLKAGMMNLGSEIFYKTLNDAASAKDESELLKYKGSIQSSAVYESKVLSIFFELAYDLHIVEIELANKSLDNKLIIFENKESRDKAIKMINNIENLNLTGDSLKRALRKVIDFYPYNPQPYVLWLIKFGDSSNRLQELCDAFYILDLRGVKLALIQKEYDQRENKAKEWVVSKGIYYGLIEDAANIEDVEGVLGVISEQKKDIVVDMETAENKANSNSEDTGLNVITHANLPESSQAASINEHDLPSMSELTGNDSINSKKITIENLVEIAKGFKTSKKENFYVKPDIPEKKIEKFINKQGETILKDSVIFYYDETLFGSGDNGVAVTDEGIYTNIIFEGKCFLRWEDVEKVSLGGVLNRRISITKRRHSDTVPITLTQSNSGAKMLYQAIKMIADKVNQ